MNYKIIVYNNLESREYQIVGVNCKDGDENDDSKDFQLITKNDLDIYQIIDLAKLEILYRS